jgi:hypothetical protein
VIPPPLVFPGTRHVFATLFSEKLYNTSQLTTTFTATRLSQNLELCSILSCSRYCQLFIESNTFDHSRRQLGGELDVLVVGLQIVVLEVNVLKPLMSLIY